jgi:transposase-like protein
LSEAQREAAVALFEKGVGYRSTAKLVDGCLAPVKALHLRWRIHGQGALVAKPTKSYSFEFKLALVERFLAGEPGPELAVEAGLSSRELLQKWVRAYRRDGADALRPKPNGRPGKASAPPPAEISELERLRRENERLRAQVAYLGKLRALREQGPR